MQGLRSNRPLSGPPEGRGEAANSDFLPALGVREPTRMQALRSNSALFWAPERQTLLIFSSRLPLGTPENLGAAYQFRPLLGHREGRGEVATSDFLSVVGFLDPRECRGCVATRPLFGAASHSGDIGVMQGSLCIFSP